VDRAEHILQASGAVIRHGEQNRAFYHPATDSIHLPDKNQFQSADNYYATALHELGHWSGHKSRLDRDLIHPFGSEGYSKEELRAEIASMLLGDELGHAMLLTNITHLADRNVQTLSGGERGRVLLARALAIGAPVLLADEPLAGLDPGCQLRLMGVLQNWPGMAWLSHWFYTILTWLHAIVMRCIYYMKAACWRQVRRMRC
jgi:ATPase subunit of ABC transporter with duplicated ATPase domains